MSGVKCNKVDRARLPLSPEAPEAFDDHEEAQNAFHENQHRLRQARLAREAAAGTMLDPAPYRSGGLISHREFGTH